MPSMNHARYKKLKMDFPGDWATKQQQIYEWYPGLLELSGRDMKTLVDSQIKFPEPWGSCMAVNGNAALVYITHKCRTCTAMELVQLKGLHYAEMHSSAMDDVFAVNNIAQQSIFEAASLI